jgi:hypothetical protein
VEMLHGGVRGAVPNTPIISTHDLKLEVTNENSKSKIGYCNIGKHFLVSIKTGQQCLEKRHCKQINLLLGHLVIAATTYKKILISI